MASAQLKEEYVRVLKGGALSYGGSQLWAYSAAIRQCGCGPVAALDTAIYLSRAHGGGGRLLSALPAEGPIPLPSYNALLGRLCRTYFPIVPPVGTNPAVLALGLDRLLREERIPLKARVFPATDRLLPRLEACLLGDSPALLAIGQNFPFIWQKHRLSFYRRRPDGSYVPAVAAKAHFVAVTGLEGDWLQISSWGCAYFVSYREFTRYVQEHSASLISGLITCAARK